MALAAAATFAGIHNENEFYSHHYLSEIFTGDIKETVKRWQSEAAEGPTPAPYAALRALARDYTRFRDEFERRAERDPRQLEEQRRWCRRLLNALGYENDWRPANHVVDDGVELPVLCAAPQLLVLEAYDVAAEGDDPLSLKPHSAQFHGEAPPLPALLDERWEEIATRRVFGQDHPPRWILLLSFGQALLMERGKWTHNRVLRFDLAEILGRRDDATLKATAVLLHRDSLLPPDGQGHGLLDRLDENSHKHAFAVSEDLKYALRESIELVGNEVVRYMREVRHDKLFDLDDALAGALGRECLRYMYRLLFLFYIEARPELGYAPVRSDAYRKGYALEHLRDLEMARLATDESRNGYYLHHSIERLFRLVRDGFDGSNWGGSEDLFATRALRFGFRVRPLDSRLFREGSTPLIDKVKLRNEVLQKVIRLMSLTRPAQKMGGGADMGDAVPGARPSAEDASPTRSWASTSWAPSTRRCCRTEGSSPSRTCTKSRRSGPRTTTWTPPSSCLPPTWTSTRKTSASTTATKTDASSFACTPRVPSSTAWRAATVRSRPATTPPSRSRAAWSSTRFASW